MSLLDEGIAANDQLLERLDETLSRIQSFRDEREAAGMRLRDARRELAEGRESPESSSLTCRSAAVTGWRCGPPSVFRLPLALGRTQADGPAK